MTTFGADRPTVLLLSGAGLPAWIWDETVAALPLPAVVAPRPDSDGSPAAHARAALAASPEGDLVVVAHSAGGVVAAELTRLAGDRVRAVVGVCAVIPGARGSFVSSLPFPQRLLLPLIMRVAGTRPPEKSVRGSLAAGVDPATVDRLVQDLTPETLSYFTSRVPGPPVAPVRGYVRTGQDRELPKALQTRFARSLGAEQLVDLPAGHLPMLTHPVKLAAAVTELSRV